MITGLHEPRATHLAKVKQVIAAAGEATPSSHLDRAYREAQEAGYLSHEFGDSHLIVRGQSRSARKVQRAPRRTTAIARATRRPL